MTRKNTNPTAAPVDTGTTSNPTAPAGNVADTAEDDTGALPVELVLANAPGGLTRAESPEQIANVMTGWDRAPIHIKLREGDVLTGQYRGTGKKRGREKVDELTGEVTPTEYDCILLDCGGTVGLVSFLSAYELADGLHNLRVKEGDTVRIIRGKTEYVEAIGRVVTRYMVGCLARKPDPIVRGTDGRPR